MKREFNHNHLVIMLVLAGATFLNWAVKHSLLVVGPDGRPEAPIKIVELAGLRVLPLVLYLGTVFLLQRAFAGWARRVSERVWEEPRALAQYLGALAIGAAIVIASGR